MPSKTFFPKAMSSPNHSKMLFHGVRFVQFAASAIVASVMFYFIHHLRTENIKMPWFFFFLQSGALTTLSWLALSSILLYFRRLSPLLNALMNGLTGCIWIVAFSLLAWRMGSIIVRGCTLNLWGSNKGVLICKLYKLLFSAAIIGIAATLGAFALDILTLLSGSRDRRGAYRRAGAASDQPGKERLRHKDLPKALFDTEETQYLRPTAPEQLYDPGANSSMVSLRSLSPAPASSRGQSPDPLEKGRRARSAGPTIPRWKEVGDGK